jgi:hypothetical protein
MPYVPFDPNKPLTQAPPAAPAAPKSGYVPFDPNAQTGGAQPQPTSVAAPSPDPGWGVHGWTGDVTMPQPVTDWGNIAGNEASMSMLPGLRTQAAAARQRLDPATAASADVAGGALSPTSLLAPIPYVGPPLAGALHEGIKSYEQGNDWSTVGKDTIAGAGGGLVGLGVGKALTSPELFKYGAGALGTAAAHKVPALFSGQELLGATGAYKAAGKAADWAGEKMSSPAAQAAIRSLVLGGTAAARASSPGPLWNQWVPGQ